MQPNGNGVHPHAMNIGGNSSQGQNDAQTLLNKLVKMGVGMAQ